MKLHLALAAALTLTLAPPLAAAQPPPMEVAFENALPDTYRLEQVRCIVDGTLAFQGAGPFRIALTPAVHNVEIVADYRLNDPVFTYLRDYAVELRAAHAMAPVPGHTSLLRARARSHGDATTPVEKRARISWIAAVR